MPNSLYIASTEPRTGKSVIILGIMEWLSAKGGRVGFFRPVIRTGKERDNAIHLVASRYQLDVPYEAMYGCTNETAGELITTGRLGELHGRILEKYKALEARSDFVVCAGTDFTSVAMALEFDFNADVANNLGALLIPVVKGQNRSPQEIVDAVRVLTESLKERRCDILGTIINRVACDQRLAVDAELKRNLSNAEPIFVIPENPILGKTSVGEIAKALNAQWMIGGEEIMDREVAHFKVAAMELPHFLDHLENGSLIITGGDRADIILGTLLSDASDRYPKVAGILLTGNLKPAPQVDRLIQGWSPSKVPVFSVAQDTFATAMSVHSVEPSLLPECKRKVAAALGIMEGGVDFGELEKRLTVAGPSRMTPLVFEYELIRRAKSKRQRIVLPEGTDERILRASEILLFRDVVDLTLLGNEDEIRQKIGTLSLSLDQIDVVNPLESDRRETYAQKYYELRKHKGLSEGMAFDAMADVSYFGTMMVHLGDADGMVSGAVNTTEHTIRPAFQIIRTKPGCSIVSSVFFMCLADRILVYGDCAVNTNPTAEQLADIAISSAATARMFGIDPRIAMLSYSTGESGKGEDVERVREATRIAEKLRPDLKIEGPIQYDAAVDASVAQSKMPGSEVAGHATVFVFPDLNTGNNTYKAVQRSANAVAIGPVLQGLKKPVNDLSRGCTVPDIVNTVAITAIQAQAG